MREPAYFARFVLEVASRMGRVVCFEQEANAHHSLIWPEMGDPAWRDSALVAIDKSRIKEAKFLEPTLVADWKFTAVWRGKALS